MPRLNRWAGVVIRPGPEKEVCLMNQKAKRIGKNTVITLAPAVLVYLFFFAVTRLAGATSFGVGPDLRTIMYNMCYSGFIALAVSYNLTSGRFDFSVGSVLILSLIVGGNTANKLDLGPVGLVLAIVIVGMVCGLVSGVIYVTLKLPPMVTSLGVAMIYEAIGFSLNNSQGVRLLGRFDILIWAQPQYSYLLLGIVVLILIYLLNFTKFGYDCRSLQTGQKNAVEVGVNESVNSVICYIIAGGLMACAGVLYLSQYGYIAPQTGLSSSSFIMSAFLPMFIGNSLAKYSDRNIGVVVGAFCQACLSSGLVALGFASSLQTVLNGTVVLVFLIYTSNSYKFGLHRAWREKKAKAMEALSASK